MTNLLREVKRVFKTGNKKTMMVSLRGDLKGYQKRDGEFYPMTSTDTAYIRDLSLNIFSVMHALTKGFSVTP